MREYRRAAHTVYCLHYHFVFITKYRKPVLRGEVGQELRELIREICRTQDIEILQGHVRPEHVHLLLSVPPHLSPSRVMQAIKGKTSHHLLQDRRPLSDYRRVSRNDPARLPLVDFSRHRIPRLQARVPQSLILKQR